MTTIQPRFNSATQTPGGPAGGGASTAAARIMDRIRQAKNKPVRTVRSKGPRPGCVSLRLLVTNCTSKPISFKNKDGQMETKDKKTYNGAFKGIVPLVDQARKRWERELLAALETLLSPQGQKRRQSPQMSGDENGAAQEAANPFLANARRHFDASIRDSRGDAAQKWARRVSQYMEKELERNNDRRRLSHGQDASVSDEAVQLSVQSDLPYVPVNDTTIRFVRSRPSSASDPDSWLPLPCGAESLMAENAFGRVSCFGGKWAPDFSVADVPFFYFNHVEKGAYAGRFFPNADLVDVNTEEADRWATIRERMFRFLNPARQRWSLPEGTGFDPRLFMLEVDPREGNGSDGGLSAADLTTGGSVTTCQFEGYEKTSPTEPGRMVAGSREAFRFTPSDEDRTAKGLTTMPGLSMQLRVVQWGPLDPTPQDPERLAYFESFQVSLRLYLQHCMDTPFQKLEQWTAHMMSNPIPFVAAVSVNSQKTLEASANNGASGEDANNAQFVTFPRQVQWLLPEYICRRCVPTTSAWVYAWVLANNDGDPDLETEKKLTYVYEDKRIKDQLAYDQQPLDNAIVHDRVDKKFSTREQDAPDAKLINLSDYHGKLRRFMNISEEGTPAKDGWQFAVAVALCDLDVAGEIEKAVLPAPLDGDPENWPTTAEAGAALLSQLEARSLDPRRQQLVYTVFAHRYTQDDLQRPEPHPTLAIFNEPASATSLAAESSEPANQAATAVGLDSAPTSPQPPAFDPAASANDEAPTNDETQEQEQEQAQEPAQEPEQEQEQEPEQEQEQQQDEEEDEESDLDSMDFEQDPEPAPEVKTKSKTKPGKGTKRAASDGGQAEGARKRAKKKK